MSKSLRFTDNGFSEVRKIYYYPAVQENHADAFSKSEVINFRFLSYHRAHYHRAHYHRAHYHRAQHHLHLLTLGDQKLPTPNTASAYRHAWCGRRPATPAHQQDWTKECRPWHCHHQAPLLRSWRNPRLRARKRASDSCGSGKTATPAHQQDWRTEHHPWHYHHQAPLLRSWPNPRSKAARKCCRHPCSGWISRVISQYTKQ